MSPAKRMSAENVQEFGPWNPGLQSSIPKSILPLATMFRPENIETGFDQAHELSDFSGISPFDIVAFRPERLIVHELLIRVTADLSVPDGPEYEELGLNLRGMTAQIFDHHIMPLMFELTALHDELRHEAEKIIAKELEVFQASQKRKTEPNRPSFLQRLFGRMKPSTATQAQTPFEQQADTPGNYSQEKSDALEEACRCALLEVIATVSSHRGTLLGEASVLIGLATTFVLNSLGSKLLGEAIAPHFRHAAKVEGYRFLPAQRLPVIMNVKGASAAGKSTIRPQQRLLAERLNVPWEDFALISPDYWRKYLLDYKSLDEHAKYGAMLTGHELEIVDKKLDRYMAEKAQAGTMPHLLIDRFRFDSFKLEADRDESSKLLTRFGDTIFMFFMITPPEETVERAWQRGLTTGRFKAVDDLLDHNIEAYTGMPALFFSWATSAKKKVHYEFLDNSVDINQRPKTIAFGWNDHMCILDVGKLLDIERFKKINVEATCPQNVYLPESSPAEQNTEFLEQCSELISCIDFADQKTGKIYGRLKQGRWLWRDTDFVSNQITDDDTLSALDELGWSEASDSGTSGPAQLDCSTAHTLGAWGRGSTSITRDARTSPSDLR